MSSNIAKIFELLFDKNNKVAYKALQELIKESEETDFVYPYMDRLSDMLDNDNSYICILRQSVATGAFASGHLALRVAGS